ncbi:DUF3891 family protein [Salibacterium sp. K-3]
MIINESNDYYVCIPQHEHARISALIIHHWRDPVVRMDSYWNELVLAVREHDRAWIPLDAAPKADEEGNPFDFTDYPECPKIQAYQKGIVETGDMHCYSGLLVSRHYASFFEHRSAGTGRLFLEQERRRQKKWRRFLNNPETEEEHLKLLQFCDDLSLYACMNRPGAAKSEEVLWFRDGFRQRFAFLNNQTIKARFSGEGSICITPFPLEQQIDITIQGCIVSKMAVLDKGFSNAYQESREWNRHLSLHSV